MATTYKKNEDGVYSPSSKPLKIGDFLFFNFLVIVFLWGIKYFLELEDIKKFIGKYLSVVNNIYKILPYLLLFSILSYFILLVIYLYVSRKNGGIFESMIKNEIEEKIKLNLIDTLLVNKKADTEYLEAPDVDLQSESTKGAFKIKIEVLPGMIDAEKLIPNINIALNNTRYKDYAVFDYNIYPDNSFYEYYLDDVNKDYTFIPKSFDELKNKNKYELILQNGLIWDTSSYPHAIISGKTGAGKSTFLTSIIYQLLVNGAEFSIIDPKKEFSVLNSAFKNILISSEKDAILDHLRQVVEILEKREKKILDLNNKNLDFGKTAKSYNLDPYYLIADEFTALSMLFDTKEKKEFDNLISQIVLRGRASGIFLIIGLQNANSSTISVASRNQFNLRILLGNGSEEDIKFIFGINDPLKSVAKFKGYYMLNGITTKPQNISVPNLFKYKINNLKNLIEYLKIKNKKF